jgi:hypothetical protein
MVNMSLIWLTLCTISFGCMSSLPNLFSGHSSFFMSFKTSFQSFLCYKHKTGQSCAATMKIISCITRDW